MQSCTTINTNMTTTTTTDTNNLLIQVMDHPTLTDNTGGKADFRNVVRIMTTNAGAREQSARRVGFGG